MPLQLTTPYDPGDADDKIYTHVKISEMLHYAESKAIRLTLTRGYLDTEGNYTIGKYFPPIPPVVIRDHTTVEEDPNTGETISVPCPDYSLMVSSQVVSDHIGEYVYNLVADKLYQYLIDNIEGFDGVII